MISGYRGNNGLGAVTVDPELMRLAGEQARAMAARDKLDHDVGRPFQERIRKSGFEPRGGREHFRRLPHAGGSIFGLARFAAAPRQYAQQRVTSMGIAAVYAPKSKYKVFWALILAKPDEKRG